MTYKEYRKALKAIEKKYDGEMKKREADIDEVRRLKERKIISEKEALDREMKLAALLDSAKNRGKRSIDRLKMNFARQDAPAKIGDLIWAKGTLMKVEDIRLAAFEYPMLKYFGVQLTMYGLPKKVQLKHPCGGIYQKDITSVNGEAYTYKVRY